MIIIDVTWPVMLDMVSNITGAKFFYIERTKALEIYSIMNGMLFRHIYQKRDEMSDALFYDTYLKNSVPVLNISHVNENEWRAAFNELADKIAELGSNMGSKSNISM